MSYIDPYMQKQLLLGSSDPNALLEAQNRPLSDPMAPLGVGMGQPPIAPYGPPVASQGLPQIDPKLQQRSQFYQGLDMLAGMGRLGRSTGYNPAQQQIDQQMANYKLQTDRMRAIQQGRDANQDPLVRGVQQFAIAAGITDKPWAEQVEAYREAKFAPESRTAGQKDTDFLMSATPEERAAYFARKGVKTETLADGSLVAVRDDGTYEVLFDSEGQIQGAARMAAETTQATERTADNAQFRATAIGNLQQSSAEETILQGALDTSESFLERIESGDLEGATGMVSGFFSQLGFGPEPLGDLDAEQVRMTLSHLGITNLAPVTVREIMMVNQMWAAASAGKKINIGRLKNSIRNIRRAMKDLEFERNRNLKELKRYGTEEDYNHYYDQYGTVDTMEELLGG